MPGIDGLHVDTVACVIAISVSSTLKALVQGYILSSSNVPAFPLIHDTELHNRVYYRRDPAVVGVQKWSCLVRLYQH